jgi:cystathionine beta-lyase
MQRHCENGEKIALFLDNHPLIAKVYWPGLQSHINHDIAKNQMKGFGGMISFTLVGDDIEMAKKVVSKTELFTLAESLGGVESLIGHPSTMTHASIPREERLKSGVVDSLIRLSVGVEDVTDLISDLEKALKI